MSEFYNVKLSEDQLKAFEAFIGRVQLNAKEVAAFNDLMGAFQQAANPASSVVAADTDPEAE